MWWVFLYLTTCFQLPPTERNTKECSLQQAVVKNKLDKDYANVVLEFAYIPEKKKKILELWLQFCSVLLYYYSLCGSVIP